MSGFDATAALEGLKALGETIPMVEAVQIGAPESGNTRTGMWVTMGDPGEITTRATGIYQLDFSLIAWWRYTVEGSEQAAEAALGDWLTELTRRLIRNRMETVGGVTRNLNGSVDQMGLPQAAAGVADYTMMAGQENRVFPVGIRVIQREAHSV